MNAFAYIHPTTVDAALAQAKGSSASFIGGGTNLLDLIKAGNDRSTLLIDINHLNLDSIATLSDGGLRLGAGARNSDVANHALVRARYPLLSQALLSGASPQLRNMATVGGNLMQRTRCGYFVDAGFAECNKRTPGSGCAARNGQNQLHAVLGASPSCVAVNPSDMSVALLALNAVVNVRGAAGERKIAIDQFHRLPGDQPHKDTNLRSGELIVSVDLPSKQFAKNYHYLKVRERASYAFALVSVAIGLQMDADIVRDARIAIGGVAHKPWPASEAAAMLVGKSLKQMNLNAVADAALAGAVALSQNAYKIVLAKNAVKRAIKTAGEAV